MFRKNIIKLSTTEYDLYLCKSCYCDRLSVSNKVMQNRFYYVLPKSGSVEEFNEIWIQNEFGTFYRFNCLTAIEIKLQDCLRIVQAILFLKQMSERVGSNIERLWILITDSINFETIQTWVNTQNPESFYIGSEPFRHCFQK